MNIVKSCSSIWSLVSAYAQENGQGRFISSVTCLKKLSWRNMEHGDSKRLETVSSTHTRGTRFPPAPLTLYCLSKNVKGQAGRLSGVWCTMPMAAAITESHGFDVMHFSAREAEEILLFVFRMNKRRRSAPPGQGREQ